jgi:hypothetical protein
MELKDVSQQVLDNLEEQSWVHILNAHRLIENWKSAEIYFQKTNYLSSEIYALTKYESDFYRSEIAKLPKEKLFYRGDSNFTKTMELCSQYEQILRNAGKGFASKHLRKIQDASESDNRLDWKLLTNGNWQPLGKFPKMGLRDVSPRNAEYYAGEFLSFMGANDVEVTKASKDSGFDVVSEMFVAQVKHLHSKVGVRALRELLGASLITRKQPVFFAKSGFTSDSIDFAITNNMLLYSYEGTFRPETILTAVYDLDGFENRYVVEPWMQYEQNKTHWLPKNQYVDHWYASRRWSSELNYSLNMQKSD